MRSVTSNSKFSQQAGPSSPPATPTTSAFIKKTRRQGMNFSGPIPAELQDGILPMGNGSTFSYNPFQPLDELSPRSSSPASSMRSSSSSEADDPGPRSRSSSPGARLGTSPPKIPSRARTRIVSEANFTLHDFDTDDYNEFDSETESIIRPHQYEDAESDRARSTKADSPGREIDPTLLHGIRGLYCQNEETDALEPREVWLKRQKEENRRKRRTSVSVQKRSLAQSIGSDTDDEDLQPVQFDANEAGSSARRLRRKVGERTSLIFDDPPPRIEELEEPESCEEVVDMEDEEQGLKQLPYYEQVMDVDSEEDD